MRIEFKGNASAQKDFNFGIQENNATEKIKFVLSAKQQNVDLTECKAFIKSATPSYSFADKEPVDIEELGEDLIQITWTILRKHSAHRTLNVQIVFEGTDLDIVWQTAHITFHFGKCIQADEEIKNQNPTIIQDFERRITALENGSASTGGVADYDSIDTFPTIGETGILYVDELNNALYRWDDENLKYYCVGNDYNNIEIINGGSL